MAGRRILFPTKNPVTDANGNVVPGAKVYFFENDTTTPKTVYQDQGLTTPHAHPVVANGSGVVASIFADEAELFSFAIRTADDAPILGLRDQSNLAPSLVGVTADEIEDALADIAAAETAALAAIGEDNSSGARGEAIDAIGTAETGALAAIGEDNSSGARGAAITAVNALVTTAEGHANDAEAAADRAEAATPGFVVVSGQEIWSGAYSYDKNAIVQHDGARYYSLINDNLGNNPGTSPEAWAAYDFAETYSYTEGLTANIPATTGGFGGDGTLGVALQNAGVVAGYLDWSASNPFRVRNAADDATLLNLSSAGLLTLTGGVAAGGALTCTTITASGALSATSGAFSAGVACTTLDASGVGTFSASGQPLVANSTNSATSKITLQDNGTTRGLIGANSSNSFIALSSAGLVGFQVNNVASLVNRLVVQPGVTSSPVILRAGSDTDTNVTVHLYGLGTGGTQIGTSSRELRVTASSVQGTVPFELPSYTVAGVPAATTAGRIIYVSNESGGAVLAFSDGTNWRRVTDRAVVS